MQTVLQIFCPVPAVIDQKCPYVDSINLNVRILL